jgi:predicted  nucleic acid-binding Zn-ribbon protein
MNANELADKLQELDSKLHLIELFKSATMLRQQQSEIAELETGLKNVWKVVEGKQAEIDRVVELYTDKAIKVEQLEKELTEAGGMIGVLREQLQEEIQARSDALDDLNSRMMKFMKSYNEMAYKLEEVGGAYTHPAKELTDEEIINEWVGCERNYYNFARTILRKAQEK